MEGIELYKIDIRAKKLADSGDRGIHFDMIFPAEYSAHVDDESIQKFILDIGKKIRETVNTQNLSEYISMNEKEWCSIGHIMVKQNGEIWKMDLKDDIKQN